MARVAGEEKIHEAFDGNKVVKLVGIDTDTAPAVTDDETKGFVVGSRWIRKSTNKHYVCEDATTGAAVWTILN